LNKASTSLSHRYRWLSEVEAFHISSTADCEQTKPNFFVKAPLRGAFTKKLVVGLFAICCRIAMKPREIFERFLWVSWQRKALYCWLSEVEASHI